MYIDLTYNGTLQGFWQANTKNSLEYIKQSFLSVIRQNTPDILPAFVTQLNQNFDRVTKVRSPHQNLHLFLTQEDSEWNLTIYKYGLELQTISSTHSTIIRKSTLSFSEFA